MCVWYIYIYIFIFFLSSKQLQTYIPHLTYKRTTPEFSTAKAICIFKFGNRVDHKAGPSNLIEELLKWIKCDQGRVQLTLP